ncbi:uncharacterized protein N7459_002509 [Penicillium hispanicum]|uniref:uncharacterized protein n=1 Tax=Penicillium hispanicum TaxID=1080232 RepID=UPI002541F2DB|nr:uncharacterized protein N7459_002509 [Penicillium hispanicum]KAJ5586744.1 hypothetical protein N7459_002509 [Penicillium hispanicum]
MYEPTAALDLHRLSRQSLQRRYESDEEDVSESEAGGQDFVPSLVGSQRAGTFDSDLSADEHSHMDPDSDREETLLAPYSGTKRPRPVSMDTIKRNSGATFAEDAYVFDPEGEVVLELPSPDSTPALASNLFLQPNIYVAPNSPPISSQRARSSSPSSIFSVENAEIQVAKKVTLMEPPTRPTLVFINSRGSRSKGAKPRSNILRPRGNTRDRESRVFAGKLEKGPQVPDRNDSKPTPPRDSQRTVPFEHERSTSSSLEMSTLHDHTVQTGPYIPPCSPRTRPLSTYRPRPCTSGSEKPFPTMGAMRSRRPTEPGRRPGSTRTNSNSSVLSYSSRPASPFLNDDLRLTYVPDYSSELGSPLSRTCSPVSCASSPPSSMPSTKRGVSNMLSQRSPMMRRMTRKHSAASSIHSMSSLRSEVDANLPLASAFPLPPGAPNGAHYASTMTTINTDSHVVRKSSQRRHARHNSSAPSGRGFMGLKLGKKSFTKP